MEGINKDYTIRLSHEKVAESDYIRTRNPTAEFLSPWNLLLCSLKYWKLYVIHKRLNYLTRRIAKAEFEHKMIKEGYVNPKQERKSYRIDRTWSGWQAVEDERELADAMCGRRRYRVMSPAQWRENQIHNYKLIIWLHEFCNSVSQEHLSLMRWWSISMCSAFSWNTGFDAIWRASWLSHTSSIWLISPNFNSLSNI